MSSDDETLIAAYLDGVSELAPDERRRVEALLAADPALRGEADAMRGVLGKLRALPHEGNEPDWTAMAHAIRVATGPAMPRPWWRRWHWLAPIGALAAVATIAMIWLREPSERPMQAKHVAPIHDAGEARPAEAEANALWLDGEAFDLDEVEPGAFEALDHEALATETDDVTGGILPATNLDWIDTLDDGAIDRAEHWLDRKKT